MVVVMTKERAHLIVLGLHNNREIKEFVFEK